MKLSKRGNSPRKILNYYAPDKRISQNKKKNRTSVSRNFNGGTDKSVRQD